MYLKIHENPQGRIVAVCDRELIGKILEDDDIYLNLEAHRNFYVGDLATEKEIEEALGDFSSANLVGKRAVGIALALEIAAKKDIIYIKDVPHIQIYRI